MARKMARHGGQQCESGANAWSLHGVFKTTLVSVPAIWERARGHPGSNGDLLVMEEGQ